MNEIDPQAMVDEWQEGMQQLIAKRVEEFQFREKSWLSRVVSCPCVWWRHYKTCRRYLNVMSAALFAFRFTRMILSKGGISRLRQRRIER